MWISKKYIFPFSIALVALGHHGELQAVHELWQSMEASLKLIALLFVMCKKCGACCSVPPLEATPAAGAVWLEAYRKRFDFSEQAWSLLSLEFIDVCLLLTVVNAFLTKHPFRVVIAPSEERVALR